MTEEIRKRGAAFGNQYARTHGFYSPVLDETEQRRYDQAVEVEGLDHEIALLRVKLMSVLEKDPENIKLITKASEALARLVVVKYNLDGKVGKKSMTENIAMFLRGFALPIGLCLEKALLRKNDL